MVWVVIPTTQNTSVLQVASLTCAQSSIQSPTQPSAPSPAHRVPPITITGALGSLLSSSLMKGQALHAQIPSPSCITLL